MGKIKKDTPAVSATITMISLNSFTTGEARCVLSECMYLYNVSPLHIPPWYSLQPFKFQWQQCAPLHWEGADISLAWPSSQCRRTESIVSLERRVCSCAELRVFSCYRGWKELCQVMCAISTTSRCKLSSSFFPPARQGAEGNSCHSEGNIRGTYTIVCHRQN